MQLTEVTNIKYLAGRPIEVNGTSYDVGQTIPKRDIETIRYLDSFLTNGFIYAVTPNKGYDRLPPHVYNVLYSATAAQDMVVRGKTPTLIPEASQKASEAVHGDLVFTKSEGQALIAAGKHEEGIEKLTGRKLKESDEDEQSESKDEVPPETLHRAPERVDLRKLDSERSEDKEEDETPPKKAPAKKRPATKKRTTTERKTRTRKPAESKTKKSE